MILLQRAGIALLLLAWFLGNEPVLAQTSSPQRPAKISAEDFGALPFLSSPEISPDGRLIVARATARGKTYLVVIDPTSERPMRQVALPDDYYLLWATWVGSRVLVSLGVPDELYGVKFHASRMMLFDPGTASFVRLATKVRTVDADDVIHIDPAGKFILLSAAERLFEYPSVWRIDLETLATTEIVKPRTDIWSWFSDSRGVVRAGLGIEGMRYWLLYRESADAKFRRVLKGRIDGKEEDSNIESYIPMPGSDKGYVIADNGTGRFGFYRYDFASDQIGEAVFVHPEVDVEDYTYSSKANDVIAINYVDDRERIHWLDPQLKKVQAQIDRALPGQVNKIISMSDSQKRMLIASSAGDDPGTYFLFDADKRTLHPLIRPYEALEGKTLSKVEAVKYRARDGLQIPAYLTVPAGRDANRLPLIIMPHGGPFTRDTWAYDAWAQFLANRGYLVLQPNFRGSTGYGKAFVEAGHGQWGRKMQDDLDDGVAWLVASGKVDPGRVCIMGASYGGYAALWAAARNGGTYRCAISFAGISDVDAMLRFDKQLFVARRYYRDWRDRVRGEGKFDLDDVSPLNAVKSISIPILLAHGKKDEQVPVTQSAKLHQALLKAGKPHEYVIYETEGHGFDEVTNSVDFLKRVDAFLLRYNPPDK